jgi:hypothetical protein
VVIVELKLSTPWHTLASNFSLFFFFESVFMKYSPNADIYLIRRLSTPSCLREGHAVAQLVCDTNWKVAGSIHDGVIGIFH